jgi:hypothetical protein
VADTAPEAAAEEEARVPMPTEEDVAASEFWS